MFNCSSIYSAEHLNTWNSGATTYQDKNGSDYIMSKRNSSYPKSFYSSCSMATGESYAYSSMPSYASSSYYVTASSGVWYTPPPEKTFNEKFIDMVKEGIAKAEKKTSLVRFS